MTGEMTKFVCSGGLALESNVEASTAHSIAKVTPENYEIVLEQFSERFFFRRILCVYGRFQNERPEKKIRCEKVGDGIRRPFFHYLRIPSFAMIAR